MPTNENLKQAESFLKDKPEAESHYHSWVQMNKEKTKESFDRALKELIELRSEFLKKYFAEDGVEWADFEKLFDEFFEKYKITNSQRHFLKSRFLTTCEFAVRDNMKWFEPDAILLVSSSHPFYGSNLEINEEMERISFVRKIN